MESKDFYSRSHLIVAAIRVLDHRNSQPPSVEQVCELLALSAEQSHRICKKLDEHGIIEVNSGPYGTRLFIRDHLKLEELPRGETGATLRKEIEKFQSNHKDMSREIEAFQSRKAKEKEDLFSRIQEKFKKESKK